MRVVFFVVVFVAVVVLVGCDSAATFVHVGGGVRCAVVGADIVNAAIRCVVIERKRLCCARRLSLVEIAGRRVDDGVLLRHRPSGRIFSGHGQFFPHIDQTDLRAFDLIKHTTYPGSNIISIILPYHTIFYFNRISTPQRPAPKGSPFTR